MTAYHLALTAAAVLVGIVTAGLLLRLVLDALDQRG